MQKLNFHNGKTIDQNTNTKKLSEIHRIRKKQVVDINILLNRVKIDQKNDTKRKGIYMLLIIFLINALVAILQSLEISPFWELPELVNTYFGNDTSDLKYSSMKFEDFGRVRGLFLLIVKKGFIFFSI